MFKRKKLDHDHRSMWDNAKMDAAIDELGSLFQFPQNVAGTLEAEFIVMNNAKDHTVFDGKKDTPIQRLEHIEAQIRALTEDYYEAHEQLMKKFKAIRDNK